MNQSENEIETQKSILTTDEPYTCYDFSSLELGCAISRDYYRMKKKQLNKTTDNKKGKVRTKEVERFSKQTLEFMYASLRKNEKCGIQRLIKDLLPEAKKDALFHLYFKKFLEEASLTYDGLAKILYGYLNYSNIYYSQYMQQTGSTIIDILDIKSKLQKFLTTRAPKLDNFFLKLVCNYFNVSPELMIYGIGEKYSVDYEAVFNRVQEDDEDWDIEKFLEEHASADMRNDESLTYDDKDEDEKKNQNKERFLNYIQTTSAFAFAEIVAEYWDGTVDDYLIKEPCWIVLDDFPFWEFYSLLKDKEKEIVENMMYALNLREMQQEDIEMNILDDTIPNPSQDNLEY